MGERDDPRDATFGEDPPTHPSEEVDSHRAEVEKIHGVLSDEEWWEWLAGDPVDTARPSSLVVPALRSCLLQLALVCAAIATVIALLALGGETIGVALTLSVPVAVGAAAVIIGGQKGFMNVVLVVPAIAFSIIGLLAAGPAGLLCSVIGMCIWLPFALLGAIVGVVCNRMDHPKRTPLIFLAIAPFLCQGIESQLALPAPTVEVTTRREIAAPPALVFDALSFYEELDHEPPFWFHLGFPRPIAVGPRVHRLGDEQVCLYDKGYVLKCIDRLDPPHSLGFTVLEQHLHFERSARLQRGDFRLVATVEGTRVEATTRYTAPLRPRFVWAPIERALLHDFHEYVLQGIELRFSETARDTVTKTAPSGATDGRP